MFSRFELKLIQFQEFCFYNEIEKAKKILSTSTSRQRETLLSSVVKEDYPLVIKEDDHVVGFSPLHLATEGGDINLLSILIANGADIHQVTQMGSPLHLAMLHNKYSLFEFLLQKGADINQILTLSGFSDNAYHLLFTIGINPFEYVHHDAKFWIKTLFQNGCDINRKNANGNKALYLCPPSCLKKVLQYGGDINLKNNAGRIPLRMYSTTLDDSTEILRVEYYISIYSHIQKLRIINFFIAEENKQLSDKIMNKAWAVDVKHYFTPENILKEQQKYIDDCLKLKNRCQVLGT